MCELELCLNHNVPVKRACRKSLPSSIPTCCYKIEESLLPWSIFELMCDLRVICVFMVPQDSSPMQLPLFATEMSWHAAEHPSITNFETAAQCRPDTL